MWVALKTITMFQQVNTLTLVIFLCIGYYVGCYEDNDDIPASKFYHSCKPGTRCGCQLNGKCDMDDPCIPIDTPYPMIKKATFRCRHFLWYSVSYTAMNNQS